MEVEVMREKGLKRMSVEMLQTVEKVRGGFDLGGRVNVTKLGRSTEWRDSLKVSSVLEIVDRNETAAVIMEPEVFKALLGFIDVLEEELEQSQVEAIFKSRENNNNWQTGKSLVNQAIENMDSRIEFLKGRIDDGAGE